MRRKRSEVVSVGKSIWLVDSEELAKGKFVGVEMISDITNQSTIENMTDALFGGIGERSLLYGKGLRK